MRFASFICILFVGIAASAIGADSPPADSFTIRADRHRAGMDNRHPRAKANAY